MARVFFAWEMGGDLGHARRIFAIARSLRALGHETGFAFTDLAPLGEIAGEALDGFAAPLASNERPQSSAPLNASDILLNRGFGDGQGLAGALRAWRQLFGLWKPDLLVTDYAPGAQLAARTTGLGQVAIGSGFSMPPPHDPMPALRTWTALDAPLLGQVDSKLVAGVRDALERIGARDKAPTRASDLFRGEAQLLCTWPEIDPFGPRERADYVGPQDDSTTGAAASFESGRGPRVVAYLKPRDPRFAAHVRAIGALAGEAIVAAPGLEPHHARSLCTGTMRVFPGTVALAPLLAQADFCICHAGPGTVAQSLAAGVPLVLLPQQVEQFLVARRVVSAGWGLMLSPEEKDPDVEGFLAQALAAHEMRAAAKSSPLVGRKPVDAAARIAARLAH